jgi:hypothetical protein
MYIVHCFKAHIVANIPHIVASHAVSGIRPYATTVKLKPGKDFQATSGVSTGGVNQNVAAEIRSKAKNMLNGHIISFAAEGLDLIARNKIHDTSDEGE